MNCVKFTILLNYSCDFMYLLDYNLFANHKIFPLYNVILLKYLSKNSNAILVEVMCDIKFHVI